MLDDENELFKLNDNLPLDYKLLEWRLIINRELYEEDLINLKEFSLVENSIFRRMNKIINKK